MKFKQELADSEKTFGIQDFGIDPDIVTMAKGLGNGVPVGACIAKKSLVSHLEGKNSFQYLWWGPFCNGTS